MNEWRVELNPPSSIQVGFVPCISTDQLRLHFYRLFLNFTCFFTPSLSEIIELNFSTTTEEISRRWCLWRNLGTKKIWEVPSFNSSNSFHFFNGFSFLLIHITFVFLFFFLSWIFFCFSLSKHNKWTRKCWLTLHSQGRDRQKLVWDWFSDVNEGKKTTQGDLSEKENFFVQNCRRECGWVSL